MLTRRGYHRINLTYIFSSGYFRPLRCLKWLLIVIPETNLVETNNFHNLCLTATDVGIIRLQLILCLLDVDFRRQMWVMCFIIINNNVFNNVNKAYCSRYNTSRNNLLLKSISGC